MKAFALIFFVIIGGPVAHADEISLIHLQDGKIMIAPDRPSVTNEGYNPDIKHLNESSEGLKIKIERVRLPAITVAGSAPIVSDGLSVKLTKIIR